MKPRLTRVPLLPAEPKPGQVVTVVTGGVVLDLAWDGAVWRLRAGGGVGGGRRDG